LGVRVEPFVNGVLDHTPVATMPRFYLQKLPHTTEFVTSKQV
jgi:hypothetical protein